MYAALVLALSGASAVSAACVTRAEGVSTANVTCPVVLDMRFPTATKLSALDTTNGLINPDYVKGNNVTWSEALQFPSDVAASRFDAASKPVEVTINNASVYNTQYGFRRAGLQFAADTNAASPGYVGVKTLHWSLRADGARALNTSHEYLVVWHEAGDYSANQFNFQIGQMIDQPDLAADDWKLFDRDMALLWSTPALDAEWENFAVTLDIDANTIQVYYSTGTDALTAVTEPLTADLSGEGQFQLGVLKKPTGSSDVVNSGYQEAPFEEGLIYGGIFVEDSADACISL